ncbi:MAG: CPBP family intramembrane metalloprotease [Verrucomicrobiota bacterium]|nr:CPBP family intramembrane metalloprotease [Verrucomicrobiota bacterium]
MLSEKPWKGEALVRLLLWLLITFFLASLLAQLLGKFPLSDNAEKLFRTILTPLALQAATLFWVGFFLWEQKISWTTAFFSSSFRSRIILIGVGAGICVLPFAWMLQQFSAQVMTSVHVQPELQIIVKKMQSVETPLAYQFFLGFVGILLAPVTEEILFRGLLYPTIKQAGFPRLALWGTAFFFAAIHINLVSFVPLVFFALVLTSLYERTNNLLAPILAHSVFNTANFIMLIYEKPISRFLERGS